MLIERRWYQSPAEVPQYLWRLFFYSFAMLVFQGSDQIFWSLYGFAGMAAVLYINYDGEAKKSIQVRRSYPITFLESLDMNLPGAIIQIATSIGSLILLRINSGPMFTWMGVICAVFGFVAALNLGTNVSVIRWRQKHPPRSVATTAR